MNEPSATEAGRLVRSSVAVAAGTLLSRLTGLVRIAVIAYAIGRATLADTYNLANTTPNIVYELLLGGVLTATLVPVFVEHSERRDDRSTSAVFTTALLALAMFTVVAVVAAPWLAWLYTFRVDAADRDAAQDVATTLIRLFLPQMCFYGLAALAGALLNARRRFVAAAYSPVCNNVVVIATFLAFSRLADGPPSEWTDVASVRGDTGLLLLLGIGTTAGIAAMALVLVPAIRHAGVHLRWVPEWRNPAVARILRLSGWTVGYVAVNQLALLFVLVLASGREGGVTAYQYAFVFFQLPHGLLAVSLMTTLVPELARAATRGDLAGFRIRFGFGVRALVLVIVPASIALAVLAQPVVGVLVRGGFGTGDARATADALQALALGLVPFSVYLYVLRGFYARLDTRTPFLVNCFENGLNVMFAAALFPALGIPGLALAYAGAYTAGAIVAYTLLARRVGELEGRRVLSTLLRAFVAGAGFALVAAPVAGWIGDETALRAATAALAGALAGGVVYVGLLELLGVREVRAVVAALRRQPARDATDV